MSYALARPIWPSQQSSALDRVLARVQPGYSSLRKSQPVAQVQRVVQTGAESLVAGGVVGAVAGYFGDSVSTSFWKDASGNPMVTVPTPALVAVAAYGSTFLLHDQPEAKAMAQRAGDVAVGIWAAQLVKGWVQGAASGAAHGEFGVDGIVDLASQT
jgi:hypothetical protein